MPESLDSFSGKKLARDFYLRPTLKVAERLLGKLLVRRLGRVLLVGRIVEVEAYLGEKDPASHAFNGKTRRNEVMFSEGGYLYVYFTYGMHFCCNVVTEQPGIGRAVLLRALEPLHGIDVMAKNRRITIESDKKRKELCNGPAKLCEALDIARNENGTDLCGDHIWIAEEASVGRNRIVRTSRIGITRGVEHRWRFHLQDNPFVSRGKPPGGHTTS